MEYNNWYDQYHQTQTDSTGTPQQKPKRSAAASDCRLPSPACSSPRCSAARSAALS